VHFGARAAEIYEHLLRAGFIVRPVAGYGLGDYLRITVGTRHQHDQMQAPLASCLRSIL
jgi:histidinol-phosphate aminotransferase